MRLGDLIKREFALITGNYQTLIISWVLMDLAMKMPVPNYQYYVQAPGGTSLALGIIGFANFFALAIIAFPGGYLADKYWRRWLITTMTFGMALSANLVDQQNRGKVWGFTNFIDYIATGVAMLLGNYLYVSIIPEMPFYVAFGLVVPRVPHNSVFNT
jgi:MFS family permease